MGSKGFGSARITGSSGARVASIDPGANSVSLDNGDTLGFDNLLIATGASPLKLNIPGIDLPGVQTLWSLADTAALLNATGNTVKPRVLMIGAGFIGLIMLNAMYKRGWQLTVVERESHLLPRMLDTDSAAMVESWLGEKGVALHGGASVQSITEAADGSKQVELADGTKLAADVVIVATGIKTNVELLNGSGIETDVGILVNDRMQTNFANIYAGGDVAQGPSLFGGQEIHSIQPTAVDHGRVAGANMAGQDIHYPGSLSMNVLDVCGLQNASFGNWSDSAAEAMTICSPEGRVYRKLMWTGDEITGAIFVGSANDVGMLTDVGMLKGIMQTRTHLGEWKKFLAENPFDIRRPYIATGVAKKLAETTLLGRPAQPRSFRYGGTPAQATASASHGVYVGTRSQS